MHALALAAVVAQAGISVTGSVVRVTGSGLGCPDWPTCFPDSLVPDARQDVALLHQWVEFGNRLLVGVVSVVALGCLVAALAIRPRTRRLTLLAAAMPAGVLAQAVIGGVTVLMGLAWWTVAVHFLVSMVLVWLAVLLVHTAAGLDDASPVVAPPPSIRRLVMICTAVLAALLTAGTMVTAAGPHAGDAKTPRLDIGVPTLAQLHADLLFAYAGLLIGLGFALHAVRASRAVQLRYRVLVVAVVAQGTLGGAQYALGVPETLVSLHVLGACLVTAATAAVWAAVVSPVPDPATRIRPATI
ncbi:MAG: heme a synthase [Pseudonocardiales bacterium]|nr:heme a synthase [Pseudonocardiales bacterium]